MIEASSTAPDSNFDFPRKSANQLRVSTLGSDPLEPDWGVGDEGSGSCVKKHKCSGSIISCATGTCTPDYSLSGGCYYCSGPSKCKSQKCT